MRYFAFHLVLAKTTFRPDETDSTEAQTGSPISPTSDDQTHTGQLSEDPDNLAISPSTTFLSVHMCEDSMDEIDPYMGFSNRLLLLINEISDLVLVGKAADNHTIFTNKARRLKSSLDNLQQHLPEFQASSSRKMAISATAETYRLGAIVLLHQVLSQPHPAASISSHVIIHVKELQGAIHTILDTIDTHLEDMIHTAALPLWPLFLAGCCVDKEDQRMTALRLFEVIEQPKRFGNITPAREVMEMVWRQRDLRRDQRRSSARKNSDPASVGQFEWERASALLGGWKISLT